MSSTLLPRWAIWTAAALALFPALLCALVLWLAAGPVTPATAGLRTAALLFGLLSAVLLGAALALFFLAFTATARGGPPSVESSWGGLGGGLGGWRLSPALVYFLGALFLAGLFGYLTHRIVGSTEFATWSGVAAPAAANGAKKEPKKEAGTAGKAAGAGAEKPAAPGGGDEPAEAAQPGPAAGT